jgi:hypothetical protein
VEIFQGYINARGATTERRGRTVERSVTSTKYDSAAAKFKKLNFRNK